MGGRAWFQIIFFACAFSGVAAHGDGLCDTADGCDTKSRFFVQRNRKEGTQKELTLEEESTNSTGGNDGEFGGGGGQQLHYTPLTGDCVGNDLKSLGMVGFSACSLGCDTTVGCVGFSFDAQNGNCILKSAICASPTPNKNWAFYAKQAYYTPLTGDCVGNDLKSLGTIGLSACSSGCDTTVGCVGFSFSAQDGNCILKSAKCANPTPSGNWAFYPKQVHYTPLTGDCVGNDLMSLGTVGFSACSLGCDTTVGCVGFSFSAQDGHCILKSAVCARGPPNGNWAFYAKPAYYTPLTGDCVGNDLMSLGTVGLSVCSSGCDTTVGCVGFSFSAQNGHCILKSAKCANPTPSVNWVFYAKQVGLPTSVRLQTAQNHGDTFVGIYSTMWCGPSQNEGESTFAVRTDSEFSQRMWGHPSTFNFAVEQVSGHSNRYKLREMSTEYQQCYLGVCMHDTCDSNGCYGVNCIPGTSHRYFANEGVVEWEITGNFVNDGIVQLKNVAHNSCYLGACGQFDGGYGMNCCEATSPRMAADPNLKNFRVQSPGAPLGRWHLLYSHNSNFEHKATYGKTTTAGQETTTMVSSTLASSIGFEAPLGPTASATATVEVSVTDSMSESYSTSVQLSKTESVSVDCNPPDGLFGYLYQWVVDVPTFEGVNTVTASVLGKNFLCLYGTHQVRPMCALGHHANADYSVCK